MSGATYPHAAGFKARDTSAEAARAQRPTLSINQARILASLMALPATPEALSTRLGIPLHTVRPRVSELVALGRVEDSGQRGPASGGRKAIIWRAKGDV